MQRNYLGTVGQQAILTTAALRKFGRGNSEYEEGTFTDVLRGSFANLRNLKLPLDWVPEPFPEYDWKKKD